MFQCFVFKECVSKMGFHFSKQEINLFFKKIHFFQNMFSRSLETRASDAQGSPHTGLPQRCLGCSSRNGLDPWNGHARVVQRMVAMTRPSPRKLVLVPWRSRDVPAVASAAFVILLVASSLLAWASVWKPLRIGCLGGWVAS